MVWAHGLTLAYSATILADHRKDDVDYNPPEHLAFTGADRQLLTQTVSEFFSWYDYRDHSAGAAEHDQDRPARRLKSAAEIGDTWHQILSRRRQFAPDTEPLHGNDVAEIHNRWMHEFMANEFTRKQ